MSHLRNDCSMQSGMLMDRGQQSHRFSALVDRAMGPVPAAAGRRPAESTQGGQQYKPRFYKTQLVLPYLTRESARRDDVALIDIALRTAGTSPFGDRDAGAVSAVTAVKHMLTL